MTADTLKTTRVLELYQDFLSGKLINKQQAAEQYHVNVRSIQRDIDSIRDFLSEQCAKEGIVRKIEYDKKENGYRLVTQEIEQLSKGEVLALCKILLESRAFTKEQVEKQLQIILNLCVSQKEKADIEWFIGNELFNYHDPAHAAVDPDNLWMVAQAVRNQLVLEIEYQKLKDRQIVKRTVEPVGLMFSEYVKKALCWFGFNLSDAVDESLCCQSDAIEQLQTFLEETASKPLNKESWANFRQQFRLLHEAAGGEVLCSGKKDRTPGTQVIEELLPLYGYQVKTSNRLKFIVKEGT